MMSLKKMLWIGGVITVLFLLWWFGAVGWIWDRLKPAQVQESPPVTIEKIVREENAKVLEEMKALREQVGVLEKQLKECCACRKPQAAVKPAAPAPKAQVAPPAPKAAVAAPIPAAPQEQPVVVPRADLPPRGEHPKFSCAAGASCK